MANGNRGQESISDICFVRLQKINSSELGLYSLEQDNSIVMQRGSVIDHRPCWMQVRENNKIVWAGYFKQAYFFYSHGNFGFIKHLITVFANTVLKKFL
jgi:hypothetical protein